MIILRDKKFSFAKDISAINSVKKGIFKGARKMIKLDKAIGVADKKFMNLYESAKSDPSRQKKVFESFINRRKALDAVKSSI